MDTYTVALHLETNESLRFAVSAEDAVGALQEFSQCAVLDSDTPKVVQIVIYKAVSLES